FFFTAEDGILYRNVTGVQTCALPISSCFISKHPFESTIRKLCSSNQFILDGMQACRELLSCQDVLPHMKPIKLLASGVVKKIWQIGRASCRERVHSQD